MKAMPRIEKFMTPMPHTIGRDLPLKQAMAMMREHGIRHLPVQERGELVGIITDRDVKFGSSFAGAAELTVDELMSNDPYVVAPDTPVNEVVAVMAEHKYGCAVVRQGNGKVVGIFTAIDGLRVLLEQLRANYRVAS